MLQAVYVDFSSKTPMPVSATITLWLFYHHLIQQELELRLTGYLFPVVACQRYQQGWYHL
ncbi:hypothetical protein O9929_24260 [Vibrio lentus]|nr:hypothetical protein [Vibrio lentus]